MIEVGNMKCPTAKLTQGLSIGALLNRCATTRKQSKTNKPMGRFSRRATIRWNLISTIISRKVSELTNSQNSVPNKIRSPQHAEKETNRLPRVAGASGVTIFALIIGALLSVAIFSMLAGCGDTIAPPPPTTQTHELRVFTITVGDTTIYVRAELWSKEPGNGAVTFTITGDEPEKTAWYLRDDGPHPYRAAITAPILADDIRACAIWDDADGHGQIDCKELP